MIKHFCFLFALVFVFSCKKEVQTETVQSAKDKSLAQMHFLDVFKNTLHLIPMYAIASNEIDTNIVISSSSPISDGIFPKTITIDFGSVNTVGQDGKTRSGKILITLSGNSLLQDNFEIAFDEFNLNETLLLGSISVVPTGNSSYNLILNENVKCMNSNGTMSWNGSGVLTRIGGENTLVVLDDIYTFSESTKGQDFKGRTFESKSKSMYTVDFSCPQLVVAGLSNFTPNELDAQVIDYGDKTCDGKVKVTPDEADAPFYFILP